MCTRCIKGKEKENDEIQREKPIKIMEKDDEYDPSKLLDISNTPTKDDEYNDPMEIMDLNGTTSEDNVINVKIRKTCELCGRTHSNHMHVKYVKEHKYWNYNNKRIEIKGITICDKCEDKSVREILQEENAWKEENCNRCNTKGSRANMEQRLEGYYPKFYCDLNCKYAQMIIQELKEIPEKKREAREDILLKKFTESNKYAGSTYGYVTKEAIRKQMNIEKVKDQPSKYDDVREKLAKEGMKIEDHNTHEDNKQIREQIIAILGIKPVLEKTDTEENMNEQIVERIHQIVQLKVTEQVTEKECAPQGIEYYKAQVNFMKTQAQGLRDENEHLKRVNQDLVKALEKSQQDDEQKAQLLDKGQIQYNEVYEKWTHEWNMVEEREYTIKKKQTKMEQLMKNMIKLNDMYAQQKEQLKAADELELKLRKEIKDKKGYNETVWEMNQEKDEVIKKLKIEKEEQSKEMTEMAKEAQNKNFELSNQLKEQERLTNEETEKACQEKDMAIGQLWTQLQQAVVYELYLEEELEKYKKPENTFNEMIEECQQKIDWAETEKIQEGTIIKNQPQEFITNDGYENEEDNE
jgi:hypothetical protein